MPWQYKSAHIPVVPRGPPVKPPWLSTSSLPDYEPQFPSRHAKHHKHGPWSAPYWPPRETEQDPGWNQDVWHRPNPKKVRFQHAERRRLPGPGVCDYGYFHTAPANNTYASTSSNCKPKRIPYDGGVYDFSVPPASTKEAGMNIQIPPYARLSISNAPWFHWTLAIPPSFAYPLSSSMLFPGVHHPPGPTLLDLHKEIWMYATESDYTQLCARGKQDVCNAYLRRCQWMWKMNGTGYGEPLRKVDFLGGRSRFMGLRMPAGEMGNWEIEVL